MPVSRSIEHPDENDIEIDQHFIDAGTGFVKVTGGDNKVGSTARPSPEAATSSWRTARA